MARAKPRSDGVYLPRRPSRLTVRWTCCGTHLGSTRIRVDVVSDEVSVSVEPYGRLIRESDNPAFPSKLQLLCPACGSNTIMGPDHPGMARTRDLGADYRDGRTTNHTWVGDVRTMETHPARVHGK
jgi:hypothetical protein